MSDLLDLATVAGLVFRDGEWFAPPVPTIRRKSAASGESSASGDERIGRNMVITTEHMDRDRDIVRTQDPEGGLQVGAYLRNPIVVLQHFRPDHAFPVIGGNAVLERLEVEGKPGWIAREWQWADTDLAREIATMNRDRILRTASIGFMPEKWHPINAEGVRLDPNDRQAMATQTGYDFARSELREWSIVAIPANAWASQKMADAMVRKSRAYFDFGAMRVCSERAATVDRVMKDVTLERCPECANLVAFARSEAKMVPHRTKAGEHCGAETIVGDPTGPTLRTLADILRDTTHTAPTRAEPLPDGAEDLARALVLAHTDFAAMPARWRAISGAIGGSIKDGRVLSARTRQYLQSAIQQVTGAGAEMRAALRSILEAAGSLQEFLAAVDRPPDQDDSADDKAATPTSAAPVDAGQALLVQLLERVK